MNYKVHTERSNKLSFFLFTIQVCFIPTSMCGILPLAPSEWWLIGKFSISIIVSDVRVSARFNCSIRQNWQSRKLKMCFVAASSFKCIRCTRTCLLFATANSIFIFFVRKIHENFPLSFQLQILASAAVHLRPVIAPWFDRKHNS